MYRVIVAGTREFDNYLLLRMKLTDYLLPIPDEEIEIISGTARGADKLGEQYASDYNLKCIKFPANWNTYGKSAGYIRNAEMAKYASQEHGVLFAFWDGKSKGTNHMIKLGDKMGLEVHVVKYNDIDKNKVS